VPCKQPEVSWEAVIAAGLVLTTQRIGVKRSSEVENSDRSRYDAHKYDGLAYTMKQVGTSDRSRFSAHSTKDWPKMVCGSD
jgi:hypothetical protein